MPHALVLNATYEPLCVVPQRRALVLVLSHKAVSVQDTEIIIRSARREVLAPSVVRLSRFIKVVHRGPLPLTRRAVFARDGGRCVYCGAPASSLDHVVPRSRGGAHVWENVVSACHRCNRTKGDRAISELGWRLRTQPRSPSGPAWRILSTARHDPSWVQYLAPYGTPHLQHALGHSLGRTPASATA